MSKVATYNNNRVRRHLRVRGKVNGTLERPRLAVFRSGAHIYAQVIDDRAGKTLASGNDLKLSGKMTKTERAWKVGKKLAEEAKGANVLRVAFDRGGFAYHGRVKALAEAARAEGLEF
jgi:large subunit ribosomal protein L18